MNNLSIVDDIMVLSDVKAALIVNPASGYNTGRRIYQSVYDSLQNTFRKLDLFVSPKPGGCITLGMEATEAGYQLLIALGGDGTAFEVVNGMMQSSVGKKPVVAFVPGGSGNSLLKEFGINTSEQAVERIKKGRIDRIDLVRFAYQEGDCRKEAYSINILGTGFVADVALARKRYFRAFRSVGYILGVLLELIRLKRQTVIISIDEKRHRLENNFVSLCNSCFTGGSMLMAPQADVRDGKIDVISLNNAGRFQILKAFPKIFKGTHIEIEGVEMSKARKVRIESDRNLAVLADGEVLGSTPLDLEVIHKGLEIMI